MREGSWVAWTNPSGVRIKAVVDKVGMIASSILVLEKDKKANMHLSLSMSVLNTQLSPIPAVMLNEDKDLMIDAALALGDKDWFMEIMQG